MTDIISVKDLQAILGQERISIIDANWYLPTDDKLGSAEFLKAHIAGAVFYDIDANSADSDLPHTLPSADLFQDTMRQLGVGKDDRVIVYDRMGYFSAPRLYWMLRYFGHENVAILDGGLQAWVAAGLPVENGESSPAAGDFIAGDSANMTADKNYILQIIGGGTTLIDARSSARFQGTAPEPRPGLRSGHIPSAYNVPFDECFDKESGLLKSKSELRKLLSAALPDNKDREIICSCGSGITACTIILALQQLGYRNVKLYDGSWSEWGADEALPIEN